MNYKNKGRPFSKEHRVSLSSAQKDRQKRVSHALEVLAQLELRGVVMTTRATTDAWIEFKRVLNQRPAPDELT